MRQRCRDVLGRGDALFAKRYPILTLWQQLAENFHVMRADFTRVRYFSEEFASYLMTGRPAMAHRDLSNSIGALLRPRDRQWLWGRTFDKRINEDRNARVYLDWMSEQMFRAMYDPRAGLTRAAKERDQDWSGFGNSALTVERNENRDGIVIRCHHLRDVAWTEGSDLRINQVHHKREDLTVRDLVKLWPKTVARQVNEALDKEPDREIKVRRMVIPADEYDLAVKNRGRFPFVSVTVDVENETVLEEKPARSLGYVIDRWATITGSPIAYSPAAIYGLPDARMLQQITLTILESGQKATDPPMIAVGEAINGGVNSGAGMITWTDADYDERTGEVLRPMEMRFDGIKFGAEREERVTGQIDAVFFLNQIRVPQVTKEMTAFEASKLYEEFQRNALPLLEPAVESNENLCSACYDALSTCVNPSSGQPYFGSPFDVPQILRGQELRWDFDTPLKAASEQAKVFSFNNMTDLVVKAEQLDPDAVAEIDMRKGLRDAVIGVGAGDWLLTDEQAMANRQQRQQAAQAQATAQQMATGADAGTRMATAVKSAAQARQAISEAGGGT